MGVFFYLMFIHFSHFSNVAFAQTPFTLPPSWLRTNAAETFPVASTGDLNGDSKPDLVIGRRNSVSGGQNPMLNFFVLNHLGLSHQSNASVTANINHTWAGSILEQAVVSVASGRISSDNLGDLVAFHGTGSIYYLKNSGQTALANGFFNPAELIDNFSFTYNIPMGIPLASPLLLEDFNHDGKLDILQASNIAIVSLGTLGYGDNSLRIYLGGPAPDAPNPFLAPIDHRLQAPIGNPAPVLANLGVVDAEWIDVDFDGVKETIVLLEQGYALGVYTYFLDAFRLSANGAGQWSIVRAPGFSQPVSIGASARPTALAVGNFSGAQRWDYLISVATGTGSNSDGNILLVPSDQQGVPLQSQSVFLPVPVDGRCDEIHSVQVGDFNQDGVDDVVALRAFGSSYSDPTAKVLYFEGPLVPTTSGVTVNSFGELDLGLKFQTANVNTAAYPYFNYTYPNALTPVKLGEGHRTLAVTGLSGGSHYYDFSGVLGNAAPTLAGAAEVSWYDSPGLAAPHPWVGYDGGGPNLGNAAFTVTATELPPGGGWAVLAAGETPLAVTYPILGSSIELLVAPSVSSNLFFFPPHPSGTLRLDQAVPISGSLLSLPSYFQWFFYDPIAGRMSTTEGMKVVPGP